MGAVYLAHDAQLDRQVALKVPHFADKGDEEIIDRFLREARAAAKIEHPNLCPVHDVGQIDGIHYMTMAYIEGELLSETIKPDQPLPAEVAAALVRTLALALQEAHDSGIIHRDLKPANIFINRRGEPVITDFGLARRMQSDVVSLTQTGAILGTPAYMSPEQCRGKAEAIGPRTDMFSLGVILDELLTGCRPFRGEFIEVLSQILAGEPEPPSTHRPGLDPRLEAICLKAMAKRPDDRFETMRELAVALGKYAEAGRKEDIAPVGVIADTVSIEKRSREVVPSPEVKSRAGLRVPRWTWIAAGSAAVAVLLGIVLYAATNHGQVKIELSDPTAQVQVKLDGDDMEISGLEQPLRVRAGRHYLVVTGDGFETKAESFTVKRGGEEVVRISLVREPTRPDAPPVALGPVVQSGHLPGTDSVSGAEAGATPVGAATTPQETHPLAVGPAAGSGQSSGADSVSGADTGAKIDTPPSVPATERPTEPGPGDSQVGPVVPRAVTPFDNAKAKQHQQDEAKRLRVPLEITNSIGMKLTFIPAGEFLMGSKVLDRDAEDDELPQHRVRITKPSYLGTREVTLGQFRQFVEDAGYTDGADQRRWQFRNSVSDDLPMAYVNWQDANEYCKWLTAKEGKTYRLPTEAEWEYACRAGTQTRFSFGDEESELGQYAYYDDNYDGSTHLVGQKKPNAWGLYDMHGNLCEWCQDWYEADYYKGSPVDDPPGPTTASYRVFRGGSWYYGTGFCRAANRIRRFGPSDRNDYLGFRVALVPSAR